jgi:gamma-glutamylcyclotransferase (GGCT)/AIG2-like uncharacterized protein YtfP
VNAVFVYGLLKPGQRLHHIAAPFVEHTAQATTRGRLYDAGVPAARFDEDGVVEGYVFRLDEARLDDALRILDDLEDEGTEYRRVTVDVSTDDGAVRAFAYEYLLPLDGCRFVGPRWPGLE